MRRFALFLLGQMLLVQATAQELPGEGPGLGGDRISQSAIESGEFGLHELRAAGLKVFSTPFNRLDGYGDGPMNPLNTTLPGGRPTLVSNGTFLRVNGLDAQSCLECHSVISNASVPARLGVGGAGSGVTNVILQPTWLDVSDVLEEGRAGMDGRFINPPFLFGSGGIELLGKEMTQALQALKDQARANPGVVIELHAKGIHFGEILFDGSGFDTSGVRGIDLDLVVRPFGRKGQFATVRGFAANAMMFHFGMQPVEAVGAGVDADGDGVSDELTVGEQSALAIFATNLKRPVEGRQGKGVLQGRQLFESIGCATCHVPELETSRRILAYSYPEIPVDPSANTYFETNLTESPAGFEAIAGGGLRVPLYSDLKRHDMGDALAEHFGHPLDPMFITARLWGVADTAPYLHDGRALTLGEAIQLHGGDAQTARDNYTELADGDKVRLLKFLRTLRTPRSPAKDLR